MKNFRKNLFVALAAASLFTACSDTISPNIATPDMPQGVKKNIVENAELAGYIDWQTYAGDDFYRYATGAWQDRTTVEPGKSKGTLQLQAKLVSDYLKSVCREGTVPALSRIFQAYKSTDKAKDMLTLQAKLNSIDSEVTSEEQAWKKMAELMRDGYCAPLDFSAWPMYRKLYAALITNESFGRAALKDVCPYISDEAEAQAIVNIGKDFAKFTDDTNLPKWSHKTGCTSQDDDVVLIGDGNAENLTRGVSFPETTPLGQIYKELGITDDEGLVLYNGYPALNEKLDNMTLTDLKRLMKYCIIDRDQPYITATDAGDMIAKMLESGDNPLRILVSRHYAQTQVPAENKARVTEISEHCRQAFMARLEKNTWLSNESKERCKDKLNKMIIFVGWPSSWDESLMVQVADGAGMTAYELVCDLFKQRASKIVPALKGKTDGDHILQSMMLERGTYTENASYTPRNNCVYLCASNLIPPIYDPTKSDAYNYAVAGATTVGHEITHGFDTSGSKFDATGRVNRVITSEDQSVFAQKALDIDLYFNRFVYGPGYRVDGIKTEVENIADLGGLHNGYDAFMKRSSGRADERLYKAREYYRAYAFGWKEKADNENMKRYLKDSHSPNCIRASANVYLTNEFYEAFGITDGNMYVMPSERIDIW